jgi:protease I
MIEIINMTLENKKILIVVAPEGFKDDECFVPKEAFERAGAVVQVASLRTGKATSEQGRGLPIDFSADEVRPENFDAVVFVGGPGMAKLTGEASFVDLARDFFEAGKLTTAICIAPVILANAGILVGKKATAHVSGQSDLEEGEAEYTGDSVTVTDSIITANGPTAAADFAKKIIKALK